MPLLQAAVSATGQPDSFTVVHDGEVAVGRIRERQIPVLARLMHERFRRCGGFVVHPSEEAALAEALRDAEAEARPDTQPRFDYTIDNGPVVQALIAQLQEAGVRSTISSLGSFFTRYHSCASGQDSANWIKTLWQGYAQGRSDVTVELFSHPPSTTPSLPSSSPFRGRPCRPRSWCWARTRTRSRAATATRAARRARTTTPPAWPACRS